MAFGSDGKLYCCGRFTNMSGVTASSIARWDGSKWEALGSGFFADSATGRGTGLAIRGADVYAIGTFVLRRSDGVERDCPLERDDGFHAATDDEVFPNATAARNRFQVTHHL